MFTELRTVVKDLPPWVLLGAGGLLGSIKSLWHGLYSHTIGYVGKKISLDLTIEDSQHRDAYLWLSKWVEKRLSERNINSITLRKTKDEEDDTASYVLMPGYGTYYMKHPKGFPMVVSHSKDAPGPSNSMSSNLKDRHTINIVIWFTSNRQVMLDLIETARGEYLGALEPTIRYHRSCKYDGWGAATLLAKRSLQSIFLEEGLVESLMRDIRHFINSKPIYTLLNIPYRRGILLEGPPGTGKSSLVLAIASELDLPVYTCSLAKPPSDLTDMLRYCDSPCIVVFEDIDTVKVATDREADSEDRITMTDFLNAIDGIGAAEGRILIMTTNHPEALDEAVTRSGRVDRWIHVGKSTDRELRLFYDRVKVSLPHIPEWEAFRASLPEAATIADAQAAAFKG